MLRSKFYFVQQAAEVDTVQSQGTNRVARVAYAYSKNYICVQNDHQPENILAQSLFLTLSLHNTAAIPKKD